MVDRILSFRSKEQNLLKFPSTPSERKNIELHRMLDRLVDIGQEEMVYAHFNTWLNYYKKPATPEVQRPQPEKEQPRELCPQELEIKSNPRAFLPRVSGFIEESLYRQFVKLLQISDPPPTNGCYCQRVRFGNVRIVHAAGSLDIEGLDISDLRSGIARIYVCQQACETKHRLAEGTLHWSLQALSYRNVNRLVEGKIKPEYVAEAIEEIEAEFNHLPKLGEKYIRPEMKGRDRIAVTRFREWMAKQKAM